MYWGHEDKKRKMKHKYLDSNFVPKRLNLASFFSSLNVLSHNPG